MRTLMIWYMFACLLGVAAAKPNFVIALADDQDIVLQGWDPMVQANRLLNDKGATFTNWMIHTPICCPSRAEFLGGRYFHNSRGDCMHAGVNENRTYSKFLKDAGYTVGYFGKYLNEGTPDMPPVGTDYWFTFRQLSYYNATFNHVVDGVNKGIYTAGVEYGGYSTSIVGNMTVNWIAEVGKQGKPFVAVMAPKAPHVDDGGGWNPIDGFVASPAPWYLDAFKGAKAPRTPNWNYHAVDHHPLIANQANITDDLSVQIDELYRTRHAALLSVDDAIAAVVAALESAGVLDNTYILYTSDHGYNLGQLRLPGAKMNVYDNDLRIPMVIRGPGITPGSKPAWIASNVDVMPTVLGLAGIDTPEDMDGRSIAPFIVNVADPAVADCTRAHIVHETSANGAVRPWKDTQLIEYRSNGNITRLDHLVDGPGNNYRALRTINSTHDFLYAEFFDTIEFNEPPSFYEYFDLSVDPYQMTNVYQAVPVDVRTVLEKEVRSLASCQGQVGCAQ